MKNLFLFSVFIVSTLTLMNCGDKGSPTRPDADRDIGTPDPFDLHLHGEAENASKYDNTDVVILRMECDGRAPGQLAVGNWENGRFTIEFPKTLDPNCLVEFYIDSIAFSNRNVKTKEVYFSVNDKDGNYVTSLYNVKETENGYVEARYIYVDSDVSISGHTTRLAYLNEKDESGRCVPNLWKINETFSVEWKKGWNIWYLSGSVSRTERTTTAYWSTVPVSGLKWYDGRNFTAIASPDFLRDCMDFM